MFKKIIGLIFLSCLVFSSAGEAEQPSARHSALTTKKNIKKPILRKKRDVTVVPKRRQRVSKARNRPQRVSRVRKRSQRISTRARPQRVSKARKRQPRAVAAKRRAAQPKRRIVAQKRRSLPVSRGRGRQPLPASPPPPPPPTYLSKLKPHTQRNAQLAGFDRLYAKGYYGQGNGQEGAPTAAVIEGSGEWGDIHSIKGGGYGTLAPEIRENYRRNFLTPIGDPRGYLHPDATNEWLRATNTSPNHAARVASVILDLAPQAQVQPVSTYYCPQLGQAYDVAEVMIRLCSPEWNHVRVINISGGYMPLVLKCKPGQNADDPRNYKKTYPRLVEACKAAAAAGKVLVWGAGNDRENIQPPEYKPAGSNHTHRYIGYFLKKLKNDPITRGSIIIANALDPNTNTLSTYSNRPGNWAEAQERSLCASGQHISYIDEIREGTSLAAPTICAALLDLLSIPGVTAQRAAKALMETADKGLDPALYGRGRMNAARAAEWLEAGNY